MCSFKPQNSEPKYARVMLLGKNLVDNWFRTLIGLLYECSEETWLICHSKFADLSNVLSLTSPSSTKNGSS